MNRAALIEMPRSEGTCIRVPTPIASAKTPYSARPEVADQEDGQDPREDGAGELHGDREHGVAGDAVDLLVGSAHRKPGS